MARRADHNHPPTASGRKRTAYRLTCGALALGTLVLLGLSWQQMRAVPPPSSPTPADRSPPPVNHEPAPSLSGLFDAEDFAHAALSGFDASLEAMDREPAHLEPPPGLEAEREWRFRRARGATVEEVSSWRLADRTTREAARTLEAAAASYEAQAVERGFEPLAPPRAEDAGARHLAFVARRDGERPMRVLTLRLAPRGETIHALIALRYAIESSERGEASEASRGRGTD